MHRECVEQLAHLPLENGQRHRPMNDVAHDDNFARHVITLKFLQTGKRIICRCNGHQLTAEPMRPSVAKMKIGNRQHTLLGKPYRAAGIENRVADLQTGAAHDPTGVSSILLHHKWNSRSIVSRGSSTRSASLIFVANRAKDNGGTRGTCLMRIGFAVARCRKAIAPSISM